VGTVKTSLKPEELYLQLGRLVEEMPDLSTGPITPDVNKWLGRACALVEQVGDTVATVQIRTACEFLTGVNRELTAQSIVTIVHTSLAKAELSAPAHVRGAFILAGHTLHAYSEVVRVLAAATTDVLMVDPYADQKIVTDYAVSASEGVTIRVLADAAYHKQTLKPAVERWVQQFGQSRPRPEVRLAPAKTLHDRLIIVDEAIVWLLGQSFNKLAERSHTSIVRVDTETATLKIRAYAKEWQAAKPLLRP
jgi:hypothetical protein